MCNCRDKAGETAAATPAAMTLERARVLVPTIERSVMCWVCPHARGADRKVGPVAWATRVARKSGRWCSGTGWAGEDVPIVDRIAGGQCPRARFTPRERTTRWLGVAWIGVPMPLRWLARVMGRHAVRADAWWGCGCVKALREWWDGAGVHARATSDIDAMRPGRRRSREHAAGHIPTRNGLARNRGRA